METMELVELPLELLLLVSQQMTPADISSLVRTSRLFLELLGPELDRRALTHKTEDHPSILHWAAQHGRKQLAERLLDMGMGADMYDEWMYEEGAETPMSFAIRFNHLEIVSLFIDRGVYVDHLCLYRWSPLFVAAMIRNDPVVRILIEAGADVSFATQEGNGRCGNNTPLMAASVRKPPYSDYPGGDLEETVRLLLDAGADPNDLNGSRESALDFAANQAKLTTPGTRCNTKYSNVLLMLLDAGATQIRSRSLDYAMYHAIAIDSDRHIQALLPLKPDMSVAIKSSVSHDNISLFFYFAEMDPSILQKQEEKDWCLACSAHDGSIKIAKYLLPEGADLRAVFCGFPMHHFAAYSGGEEILRLLLENGADPQAKSMHGSSALHAAASGGDKSVARILIEQGVGIDSKDEKGHTPLFTAFAEEKLDMANFLLDAGANITETDENRRPLLHSLSCLRCDEALYGEGNDNLGADSKMVDLFLKHGFDINHQDDKLMTPLHHAVDSANVNFARILLERGADPTMQSDSGSALTIARSKIGPFAGPEPTDTTLLDLLEMYASSKFGWKDRKKDSSRD